VKYLPDFGIQPIVYIQRILSIVDENLVKEVSDKADCFKTIKYLNRIKWLLFSKKTKQKK
jgi:hypothetical protein